MCDDMVLSLKSDTFNDMKDDFDTILSRTLGNMQMRGADSATITLKFGISLFTESCRDWNSKDETAMRQYQRPAFKHEISSVMQIKDKITGSLDENVEMVYDPESNEFVTRKLEEAQRSIFDDEPVYADAEVSDVSEVKALPGDVAALTGDVAEPEEEIINTIVEEEADADTESPVEDVPFSDLPEGLGDDYEYDEPADEE